MSPAEVELFKRLVPAEKGCVLDGPVRGCCNYGTLGCRIEHPSLWTFMSLTELVALSGRAGNIVDTRPRSEC